MKRLLLLTFGLGLASMANAQVLTEDFDSGTWPAAGWTVVDNLGNGSWNTSSVFGKSNLTGGSHECASIDSDYYGSGVDIDGELITPAFDIPAAGYFLEFQHNFYYFGGEIGDVDISVGGGAWTNLASYSQTEIELESIDLTSYAGATGVQIRFHYYQANYTWYWQIDDVKLDVW